MSVWTIGDHKITTLKCMFQADYLEKYNKTKEFYIKEYPSNPLEEKYQNMSKCRKNISDKEIIFYQDHDTTYWETENKSSYKKNN
ncbi:hypothetical protein YYC_04040 [Plasmodium yoelii 17X]|uniref:Uncharacterized protein n=1 Tax=Plasmodium yoelii 17X TaxID=1323249 RepID=V7PJE1_PLAYE|nr:hypothetical protein YYC_04040 [Plasmodium yoelii 17X]